MKANYKVLTENVSEVKKPSKIVVFNYHNINEIMNYLYDGLIDKTHFNENLIGCWNIKYKTL